MLDTRQYGTMFVSLLIGAFIAILLTRTSLKSPVLPDQGTKAGGAIGTAQLDLNGDNVLDHVSLSMVPDAQQPHELLTVNDVTVQVPGFSPVGYFGIVDLDVYDGQHEIALSDFGPSTDYTTSFFAFDGKSLKLLGTTQGLYEQMLFNGDGSFVTTTRGRVLDTWFHRDTFKLSADTITHVPKDFYERLPQTPITVLQLISLQTSPADPTKAFTLRKGDTATIVGCDDATWCKVRNGKGATGWFALENFDTIKGMGQPAGAFFDGLSYAD